MIAALADAILILVLIEGLALLVLYRRTGRGIAPRALIGTLAAGFFLVVALRLALGGAAETLIAASLSASLVAHLVDLAARWRRG